MVPRKVNNKYPLDFCGRGAATSRVSEVDDQTETLESYALKKAVRPDLELYICDADQTPTAH
jgi:hypothetical protein